MSKGIITKVSVSDFETTFKNLKDAIEENPNLQIIAELDHQLNAAKAGLNLNPTRILMFGNPQIGTPLMNSSQTMGLDLPQKMLVHEDDEGTVNVSYYDPTVYKEAHDINDHDEIIEKIAGALDKLSNIATGKLTP